MSQKAQGWKELGERLAHARKTARLNQADLAAAVELDRTAVTRIESGDRKVDFLELARIAEVLRRPIDWFLSPPLPAVVSRRQNPDVADESQADVLLEGLARDVALLTEMKVLSPPAAWRRSPAESVEGAEAAARDLRRHLDVGTGPIWDLARLAERVGLYAFGLDLGEDALDGSYLALEPGGVALVNGRADPGRRRFTLVHELGHHVFADQYSPEWILAPDGGGGEKLINAFAIHFLAPREAVVERWRQLAGATDPRPAAIVIAADYGVSWTAACNQLRTLGLVDDRTRERLVVDRPRRADYLEGGVALREELVPPAVPPGFAQAVMKAYRRHKVSGARAVELLRGTLVTADLPPEDEVPLDAMRAEVELD